MDIAYAGELGANDVRQALVLHQRAPVWARALVAAMFAVVAAGMAGNAAVNLWPALQGPILRGLEYVPLLALAGFVMASPWLSRYLVGMRATAQRAWLRRWGQVSQQGFSVQTEVSKLRFDWAAAISYAHTDAMVLLYLQPSVFHVFPRRFFASDSDWQAFVKLVQENLPEAAPLGRDSAARSLLIVEAVVLAVALALYFAG